MNRRKKMWSSADTQSSEVMIEMVQGTEIKRKGYVVPDGYRGWTGTIYALFATEKDYTEWLEAKEEKQ